MITRKIIIAIITSIFGIMMLSGCGKTIPQSEAIHTSETTVTTIIIQPQIKGQAVKEDLSVEHKKLDTTTSTTTQTIKTQTTNDYLYYEIPDGDTSFYAYMDWTAVTDYNSPQYDLLSQGWTDSQGIRRVEDDVCIALGTYYTDTVGDRFIITTDMGNSYTAIVGDIKADCHTDSKNQYRLAGNNSKNVVEFIVDTNSLDYAVRTSGNIGTYNNYSGQFISIQKIS